MGNNVYVNLHGQQGDIMSAMSVIRYRKELWGDAKIIWYADRSNFDLFAHQDIEVREFPRGFGYPEMVEEENKKLIAEGKEPAWADWQGLMDENNHLNLELAKDNPYFKDAKFGYFPAPHQIGSEVRKNIEYPNCSKVVFGIPMDWEWHPVLMFSQQERDDAKEFIDNLFFYTKTIAIESFAGSGQSLISDVQVRRTMEICNEVLGVCNFIFVSHKYMNGQEEFPDEFKNKENIYFAKHFTVRQCALITNQCDLLISVSSGISVATSAWEFKDAPVPILQFCGSNIASTQAMKLGRFELVTHDLRNLDTAVAEYEEKLIELLKTI